MPHQETDWSELLGDEATRDAVPYPGDTFVIVSRTNDHAIVVADGKLRLKDDISEAGNCYWECVEKDGWLGFRETELGGYLGHDFWWNFTADAKAHEEYQFFQTRGDVDGGFQLLTPSLGKMVKLVVGKEGNITYTDGEGTPWEFIKVEVE